MNVLELVLLSATLVALAALPSTSVGFVVLRSTQGGFRQGLAAAAGIAAGDLIFVLLALAGLAAAAAAFGAFFAVLRIAGGVYLIWLGIRLIRAARSRPRDAAPPSATALNRSGSFLGGLLLTLGDLKAILFYGSFFPAFVDIPSLGPADVGMIALLTVGIVGGVKVAYAAAGGRLHRRLQRSSPPPSARIAAGGLLVGAGCWVVARQ